MKRSCSVIVLVACLGVGACVPVPESASPAIATTTKVVSAFPEDVNEFVLNTALARQIAKRCPTEFAYNGGLADRRIRAFDAKYAGNAAILSIGGKEAEAVNQDEVLRQLKVYSARRKIVAGSNATWCPAGRAEIVEGTAIGAFLVKR